MFRSLILRYTENRYYFLTYYRESPITMYKLFTPSYVYIFIKKIMRFSIHYHNQKPGFHENFRNITTDYSNTSYLKKNFLTHDTFLLQMSITDEVLPSSQLYINLKVCKDDWTAKLYSSGILELIFTHIGVKWMAEFRLVSF